MKLFDYFKQYNDKGVYPFHMPGHKRKGNAVNTYDYTEVEGLDNLYHSEEILRETMDFIGDMYGVQESLLLVNGSTAGILTAVTSVVEKGEEVLVSRNCHKAVYNAIELWGIKATYIVPECCDGVPLGIDPLIVKKCIEANPNIKAMVMTSPTYEGVVSDIKSIAEVCHSHNVVLIVDEAHGSHMKFSEFFPESAVNLGGDIVVHSTHKTLTSLTGTGVLHICSKRVNAEKVKKRWQCFQTSSPNYILMASIDKCYRDIKEKGGDLFKNYTSLLDNFYTETEKLCCLKIYRGENNFAFDKSKILILTNNANITGIELQKILRENYKIELEMASINYALAMTSINDTENGFNRLINALLEIDKTLQSTNKSIFWEFSLPKYSMSPYEAECSKGEFVILDKANGRISKEYIYAYPPGIPIIVPGEVFSDNIIKNIKTMLENEINLISESNKLPFKVQCTIDTLNKMG
jgi:arginine/lysine/ornithine decarboxylase